MTTTDDDMGLVERLLAEAAATPRPAANVAFMARILADAERLRPLVPGAATAVGKATQGAGLPVAARAPGFGALAEVGGAGGWLGGLAEVFGGRAALAGMMLATVFGLYLGIAQPAALSGLSSNLYGQAPLASLDLMAGSDSLWTGSQP